MSEISLSCAAGHSRRFRRSVEVPHILILFEGDLVAAKAQESNLGLLSGLADHAHKLLREFVGLPNSKTQRAAELLADLEQVIAEFKRLRPPPTFKRTRPLQVIPFEESRPCSVCGRPVDLGKRNYFETDDGVCHSACYNGLARPD